MKQTFFVAILVVMLGASAIAQFTRVPNSGLPNVLESAVALGDFDKDGYVDVLLSGINDSLDSSNPSRYLTRVYKNNGNGTFSNVAGAKLMPMYVSTAAWGDYDNDGYLDILVGGVDTLSNQTTKLYRNINGTGTFTEVTGLPFQSSSYGCVAWGDYNNDGYLDVLSSGFYNNGAITKLYRNEKNGTFTEVTGVPFQGVNGHSKVAWADFNNDGYLDVVLCGRSAQSTANPKPITKVYFNNGGNGTFTEDFAASIIGVWRGSMSAGDYNKDGLIDLIVAGITSGDSTGVVVRDTTLIYINNGDSTFRVSDPGLPGVAQGVVVWGDYDGDGYMDILMNGYSSSNGLFRNLGNGDFTAANLSVELAAGGIAWGDINNDGYLDCICTGVVTGTKTDTTIVYRYSGSGSSAAYVANVKPSAPTLVSAALNGSTATLTWNRGSDTKTPKDGLTYALRLGTTPGGIQRISPLADTSSGASNGFRRVAGFGYANHDTSWAVENFAPGKYYWSVQAIDNAFAGSVFSTRGYFALPYTITAAAGPNGSITPSGSVSVLPDSSRRFSIKPASNYHVDSLIVDAVRVPNDTAYTFSAVAANHTIRATFAANSTLVSIAEARKDVDRNGIPDHLGDTLAVVGFVNSVNIQTTSFGYFIQDSSAGIHVFNSGLTGAPVLRPGYRIAVSGKIDYVRGTTEIVPFDLASNIVVIDTGNAITAIPLSISSYKANPEAYESRRIVLDVVQAAGFTSAQWPTAGSDANLNIWNGKDSLILHIDRDTQVDGSPYPLFPVRVTGVATQFTSSVGKNDDGYQITPMFVSDFVPINAPPIRFFGLMSPANGSRLLVDTVGTRQYKFKWHPSIDFNNNRLTYTFQPVGLSGLPSDSSGIDTVKTLTGAALRAYLGAADSLIFKWTVLVKDSLNPAVACIDTFSVMLKKVLVGVHEVASGIPAAFELSQNYPNPFNPSTTIRYGLPQKATVSLTVFNALGQKVADLAGGEEGPGYHEVRFDASGLASGLYFYRLQADGPSGRSGGSFVSTKKLVLVK